MADEHILIRQASPSISMTCADGTGIAKGTVLKLSDPFTVSATSALNDIVGGIASMDKIANDGVTSIAVLRGLGNILRATASGAIAVGDPIGLCGADGRPNLVRSLLNVTGISGAKVLGIALETAADRETFLYELNIQSGAGAGV